jgi:hypothetical protein
MESSASLTIGGLNAMMKMQRRFQNMKTFGDTAEFAVLRFDRPGFGKRRFGKQGLAFVLSLTLLFATWPQSLSAQDSQTQDSQTQDSQAQASQTQDAPAPPQDGEAPSYAQQTPEQLQRLVAPIALYPDSLVAQILAASTFPEEVVEADRWVQSHPDLKGADLGKAVDQQPWDPSVKALAAFPSVLGNMDKNLSWTSSLGDAYYNQQQDVMDAVQVMRRKAQDAGALKTTPQEVVKADGPTIVVEPADPDIVYVPAYDPWLVYGYPIVAWPGWYPYPGIWFGGPYLSFGIGFGIGWFGGFGWGWGHWGFDWHNRYAIYNHGRYYSRSRTFYNRSNFYRGGGERGGFNGARGQAFNRPGAVAKPFEGNRQAARGYNQPRGESGVRSGAFSGYDHGGEARTYSSRGSASMGGFHGGGGSRGGGGSHGGGGRH